VTLDRSFWVGRGEAIASIWQELRPHDEQAQIEIDDEHFLLWSYRWLDDGVYTASCIEAFPRSPTWTAWVYCIFADRRVRELELSLGGPNPVDNTFMELRVLNTLRFIEGREFDSQSYDLRADIPVEGYENRLHEVLGKSARGLDEIWASVGGYGKEGMQRLALWAMRHYNHTGARPTVATVCAALAYGDKECARWVLREYEDSRILFVRHGIDSYTRGPSGEIRPDIAKLLEMLE